jgi:hypothetical protein
MKQVKHLNIWTHCVVERISCFKVCLTNLSSPCWDTTTKNKEKRWRNSFHFHKLFPLQQKLHLNFNFFFFIIQCDSFGLVSSNNRKQKRSYFVFMLEGRRICINNLTIRNCVQQIPILMFLSKKWMSISRTKHLHHTHMLSTYSIFCSV